MDDLQAPDREAILRAMHPKLAQVLYDLCKAAIDHDDADAIFSYYNNIAKSDIDTHTLLKWTEAYMEEQEIALHVARRAALAKLTTEECKLLGLRK